MGNNNLNNCKGKLKQCENDKNKLERGLTGMFLQVIGIEMNSLSENMVDDDFKSIGDKIVEKLKEIYKST
jgi:hypothetical protein